VTFTVSILGGVLAAMGMVLHEYPEGIVTLVLLERGGFSRTKSASYAFVPAAISTQLGTLASYPFTTNLNRSLPVTLPAISAGVLVYVGASHLLPAVERENKAYRILALAALILVAVIIILSKGR
jgi:zinc transporter ZupT